MTKQSYIRVQQRLQSAKASTQSDQLSICPSLVAKDHSFGQADGKGTDQNESTSLGAHFIMLFCHNTVHYLKYGMKNTLSRNLPNN